MTAPTTINGAMMTDELISLLREIRPSFSDAGSRDVDTRRKQNQIDSAIELLSASKPAVAQGWHDGIEAAAQVCDKRSLDLNKAQYLRRAAQDCALAIRALAASPQETATQPAQTERPMTDKKPSAPDAAPQPTESEHRNTLAGLVAFLMRKGKLLQAEHMRPPARMQGRVFAKWADELTEILAKNECLAEQGKSNADSSN